jgi:hypothetical protein
MVGPRSIRGEAGFQNIGKEEKLEDGENNEKLDQQHFPEGPSQGHGAETLPVEITGGLKPPIHGLFLVGNTEVLTRLAGRANLPLFFDESV